MILQLSRRKVSVKPSRVPEPMHKLYVQYVFEFNTNHLTPRLTMNHNVFEGNHIYINVEQGHPITADQFLPVKVELLNGQAQVVATYFGGLPYHRYCLFGPKPVHPDVEMYIRQLEARIEELEAQGEVI